MTTSYSGRRNIVIINRSFWPIYPVIGEALLRLAEKLSVSHSVSVILQDHVGIRQHLAEKGRGEGVEFFPGKAWSISSSGILVRALDTVYFMCWVVITLLRTRPQVIYVSTDPPVLIPFVVMIYARLFRAHYIYHLQDIHPEAASVVVRVQPLLFRLLRWMDCVTMRRAQALITITDEMAEEIRQRSGTKALIHVISNPAVSFDQVIPRLQRVRGFSFCGNLGRLQRIPLMIESITEFLKTGGKLRFAFAGGGLFSSDMAALAKRYDQVEYLGKISATDAAQLNCDYEWALLPIEDEVTRYAFPSKSSSYVFSGAAVIAVCGEDTSVARWVSGNRLGVVVPPTLEAIVETFRAVEKGEISFGSFSEDRSSLKQALSFEQFLQRLDEYIVPELRT
jgi:glycosyltransferase involved in cell wall biosynthesis